MIFDLIAANGGGRKYLFNKGKSADIFGGFASETSDTFTVNGNGVTVVNHPNGKNLHTNIYSKNNVPLKDINKVFVLFDYFNEKNDLNVTIRIGFGSNSHTFSDEYFAIVEKVSTNENAFIVEIDVSSITENLLFKAGSNDYYNTGYELGAEFRIRSIWYE